MTPDPSASRDDSLDVLRGLGRTIAGICLLLVLAGATLVIGNGAGESFALRCAHDDAAAEGFSSVRHDVSWFPPRLVCVTTTDDGLRHTAALPLSTRTVTVFAGLAAAWTAAAGFALAVAVRPARIRLLDRAAATWLLGVLTAATLVQMVVSMGRRYTEYAPASVRGLGRALYPGWLFPGVVACVVAGAILAAARAHRIAGAWAASLATALTVGLYLIFTGVIHPLRLPPSGAVTAGLAAGAAAHAGRALIRRRKRPPDGFPPS